MQSIHVTVILHTNNSDHVLLCTAMMLSWMNAEIIEQRVCSCAVTFRDKAFRQPAS